MSTNEWQCYIALKEGVLFEGEGRHRWWHVVPLPARTATPEQTARHYGLRVETVNRYERRAREMLTRIRAAAGLIGDEAHVPVWPVMQSDDALLAYLFDERW
jgi:exopolyphosphatase/pppGpp-phosphohydrolase